MCKLRQAISVLTVCAVLLCACGGAAAPETTADAAETAASTTVAETAALSQRRKEYTQVMGAAGTDGCMHRNSICSDALHYDFVMIL